MKERRQGLPRTDVERAATHFGIPEWQVTDELVATLPPRGYGLQAGTAAGIAQVGQASWPYNTAQTVGIVAVLAGTVYANYRVAKGIYGPTVVPTKYITVGLIGVAIGFGANLILRSVLGEESALV